ncbi:MAG: glycosyl hydrolase family 5, partial [Candidatus Sulfotelmatobacter sp.]
SVMLVNRDQFNDHSVKIEFDGAKQGHHFSGNVDRITFGSDEYQWHEDAPGQGGRENGHADPDGPPSKSTVMGDAQTLYQIPKASITVLRGRIAP